MDAATSRLVRQRADGHCEYCRLPQTVGLRFHVEHIRARQHGGGDDLGNLALACPECNLHKGPNLTSIDPKTDEIVALYNPRMELWSEHFLLDGFEIRGQTAVGRATVELLRFNAPDRIRLRELTARLLP